MDTDPPAVVSPPESTPGFLARTAVAVACGCAVTLIATVVAWHNLARAPGLRYRQWITSYALTDIAQMTAEFRRTNGVPPRALADLIAAHPQALAFRRNPAGPVDGWGRPFLVSPSATAFTVTSLGRDGRPGGAGLDSDLTTDQPDPMGMCVTLRQFVFETPSAGMLLTCLLSGVATLVLCWKLAKPLPNRRTWLIKLLVSLPATLIGAVIVAAFLAAFHVPNGH